MKRILFLLALMTVLPTTGLLLAGVHLRSSERLEMDRQYDGAVDPVSASILAGYEARMDSLVNRPIGKSIRYMEAKAPESSLSNLLGDLLLAGSQAYLPKGVDMALINIGGIRSTLPAGIVTAGDFYRIMPFENELTILELKANDLLFLLKYIAENGGEGISNVRMEVRKGVLSSLSIGGKPFDESRTYRVATLDYLADGNGGMFMLRKALNRTDTHVKVRDIYIRQVEKLTAEGKDLDAKVEGRIRYTFR